MDATVLYITTNNILSIQFGIHQTKLQNWNYIGPGTQTHLHWTWGFHCSLASSERQELRVTRVFLESFLFHWINSSLKSIQVILWPSLQGENITFKFLHKYIKITEFWCMNLREMHGKLYRLNTRLFNFKTGQNFCHYNLNR